MIDLDKELFDENPISFLRRCFIHFSDDKSVLALKARMYGATICGLESPNLTHVVVSKKDGEEYKTEMKEKVTVPLVSDDWLEKCLIESELVSEVQFKLIDHKI